jgi:protein MAK16
LVAGGTDEDDVLDDPVSKKPKGSSSYSKQNVGKRSRKVMTEVNIAKIPF